MSSERVSGSELEVMRTPFGDVKVILSSGIIKRIFLPFEDVNVEGISKREGGVAETLKRHLEGEETELVKRIDESQLTEFQKRVFSILLNIPRGRVTSYRALAEALRSHPRAIARALARNPFPLLIPCHRVVHSDGSLGGYKGGGEMKRWLLEIEGVEILNGRVYQRLILTKL